MFAWRAKAHYSIHALLSPLLYTKYPEICASSMQALFCFASARMLAISLHSSPVTPLTKQREGHTVLQEQHTVTKVANPSKSTGTSARLSMHHTGYVGHAAKLSFQYLGKSFILAWHWLRHTLRAISCCWSRCTTAEVVHDISHVFSHGWGQSWGHSWG